MLGAVLEKAFKCSSINNMFEVGKTSVLHKVWQYEYTLICHQHFQQTLPCFVNYFTESLINNSCGQAG